MDHCEHEWLWLGTVGTRVCKWCRLHARWLNPTSIDEIMDYFWDIAQ